MSYIRSLAQPPAARQPQAAKQSPPRRATLSTRGVSLPDASRASDRKDSTPRPGRRLLAALQITPTARSAAHWSSVPIACASFSSYSHWPFLVWQTSVFNMISYQSNSQKDTRTPFEQIVLLLQGGGALGSYQAGVYQALAEADLHPNWVAGISIGAINAAIIAGNAPDKRVDRLREFWHAVSTSPLGIPYFQHLKYDDSQHQLVNQVRAMGVLLFGA